MLPALLLALMLPAMAQAEAERPATDAPAGREIVEARLPNGIPVVAVPTGERGTATVTMVFPGGSRTDPHDIAGVARLAASLADRGVNGAGSAEIAAHFERLGAQFTASAGSDGTLFSLTAPLANLAEAGELAARIVTGALYPDEAFVRERARAVRALAGAMADPVQLARRTLRFAMHGEAPYGTQPDGTAETLANITRDDLLWHRQIYYHPARMRIVVSGGLPPGEAIALVEGMFGEWRTPMPFGPIPREPAGPAQPPRTILIERPGAAQAAILAAVRAPARGSEDHFALVVLTSVLGERLRERGIETFGTEPAPADSLVDDSLLVMGALAPGEEAGEVAAVMLEEFARLASQMPEPDLFEAHRGRIAAARNRAMENGAGLNLAIAELLLQERHPSEVWRAAAHMADIDPQAASAAAREYLAPEAATLVVVGDAQLLVEGLRTLRGDVEVIAVEEIDRHTPGLPPQP